MDVRTVVMPTCFNMRLKVLKQKGAEELLALLPKAKGEGQEAVAARRLLAELSQEQLFMPMCAIRCDCCRLMKDRHDFQAIVALVAGKLNIEDCDMIKHNGKSHDTLPVWISLVLDEQLADFSQ